MKQSKRNPDFRQGEVAILALANSKKSALECGFKEKADNVIVEGEISGHKHEIENGKLYEKGDKIVLEAFKGCVLKHPEHASIAIPEGKYEIKLQEEYDEKEHKTKVRD